MKDDFKIFPLSENAVTIEFGNEISESVNDRVLALSERLSKKPFSGFIETFPAYSSLTVFYNLVTVRREFAGCPTAFDAVKAFVEKAARKEPGHSVETAKTPLEIPVFFNDSAGPDLEAVAEFSRLSRHEIVEIFTSRIYRVYMLGFLPGFAYMGTVNERLAIPRKRVPRLDVPKGSVGIAGTQTGIYPFNSPGGWQIIGRTTYELFTPDDDTPCLLAPGDLVKFYEVEEI